MFVLPIVDVKRVKKIPFQKHFDCVRVRVELLPQPKQPEKQQMFLHASSVSFILFMHNKNVSVVITKFNAHCCFCVDFSRVCSNNNRYMLPALVSNE